MSVKEYNPVLDEDYKRIAQVDYGLDEDESCCYEKTFDNFLSNNTININYKIPETGFFQIKKPAGLIGGTMLHASFVYIEHFKLESIRKYGADITIKNADGSSVVHLAVAREYESYFESWKDKASLVGLDFCSTANSLLSSHVDFNIAVNPSNNHGISHFHIACMGNHVDVVKFFLQKGISVNEAVNQDSPMLPGFTPLHFAVKYCNIEVAKELLKQDADIHVKDAKGMSPLHLLIDERLKIFIQMLRAHCCNYNASERHYNNLKIYFDKNEKLIGLLLKKSTSDFIDTTGFSNFHATCTLHESSVDKFLMENEINLDYPIERDSSLCPGYTGLHFASHFNADTVKLMLLRGANMKIENAKGATAFDICLQNFRIKDIHGIVMLEPDLESIVFTDNKTKLQLLILAMEQPKSFATFLKNHVGCINAIVPLDSPFCPGNTPLHFAAVCTEIPSIHWDPEYADRPKSGMFRSNSSAAPETQGYLDRVKSCLELGADVTTRNKRGFSPLHLAFRLQASRAVQLSLQYHVPTVNPVDVDGLSHLHIASAANNGEVVAKLLENGADVNATTRASFVVGSHHLVASGSTPLHFAVIARSSRSVRTLLEHGGADVTARDSRGITALERFYGVDGIGATRFFHHRRSYSLEEREIVELLLGRVAVEAMSLSRDWLGCCRILSEEVLTGVLRGCDVVAQWRIFDSVGITRLHVASWLLDRELIVELLQSSASVDAQVNLDSPLWPGCTPLHLALTRENASCNDVVAVLLAGGAGVTLQNAEGDTPLHAAFNIYRNERHSDWNLVNADAVLGCLRNFSVNPREVGGVSHFHIACARGAARAVEGFLKHGVDVDLATDYFDHPFGGFTPLHFAARHLQADVVEQLIERGANVHWRTTADDTPLHSCFRVPLPYDPMLRLLVRSRREYVIEILINAGVDVNAKNMFGESVMRTLMKTDSFTSMDIVNYVERGCRFNDYDIDGEGLMAIALKKLEEAEAFKKLIEQTGVERIDATGRNAIYNVVSLKRPWPVMPIEVAFVPTENYSEVIEHLMGLGLDIDCQDEKGLTPLHAAAKMQNITGLVGLLENGADINVVDQSDKTPFDYSFEPVYREENELILQLDQRILKVFALHVRKLDKLGLEISESNKEILTKVQLDQRSLRFLTSVEFRNEIASLKSRRFAPYQVTLYDFLSETGAVAAYPHMLELQRHAIEEFFKTENSRKEYPMLSGLLVLQYRKALARTKLIGSATDSIRFLVGFDIPDVCSTVILRFLTNADLKNLITLTDAIIAS